MNFDAALNHLRDGNAVKRSTMDQFFKVKDLDLVSVETEEPVNLSSQDVLADDWEVMLADTPEVALVNEPVQPPVDQGQSGDQS